MRRRILIPLLLLVAHAGSAEAQLRTEFLSERARAEMAPANATRSQSVARHSLHALAGAVLGAGIGYFTSHVVYNDWDKANDLSYASQRRTYSLSGAAVGALAGLIVGSSEPAPVGPAGLLPTGGRGERDRISMQEISESGASNAYQLVQSLRPNWLVTRGTQRMTEQGVLTGTAEAPVARPGLPQIMAYLGQAQLGGAEQLQKIPAVEVESIEWLSAADATLRFGAGHTHGAILVQTKTAY